MNINIYKSPQMCLYYESNTNSCWIPAGILPESTESGHSCRIPGFLPDSAGIPPEFPDSGRNQWGSEKFCLNSMDIIKSNMNFNSKHLVYITEKISKKIMFIYLETGQQIMAT